MVSRVGAIHHCDTSAIFPAHLPLPRRNPSSFAPFPFSFDPIFLPRPTASITMPIPRPPSPPPLSLPQDSDDLNSSTQPPLCTPIDQPVQHIDFVTVSPKRKIPKRRRTALNSHLPLQLQPSLISNYHEHPTSRPPTFNSFPNSLNDDDSQPAQSQSTSQRDLPDMSQDTLSLFPPVVRDFQHGAKPHSFTNPTSPMIHPSSDNIPPRLPNPKRNVLAGLARASMLSTLSASEALSNPFLQSKQNPTNNPIQSLATSNSFVMGKVSNASQSLQDIDFHISLLGGTAVTDNQEKKTQILPATTSQKEDEERLLKLLLVSSSQGRKLSLDFVFRGLAGKGSFSEVSKVTHRLDGTTYAVKKNLIPMLTNHARKDAIREVFALSALQGHPNIIRYYDAWFEEKGRFLMIQTEFLEGGSLYSIFVDRCRPMDADQLFYLASDMSHALSYIHDRGIIHLDVKPDNIFQSDRGLGRVSYLLGDFGLACKKEGFGARSTEGDARYLCPEALSAGAETKGKDPQLDLCARDIFSLGVTLYELGMGIPLEKSSRKKPESEESLKMMASELGNKCGSAIIENIVKRCLTLDPQRRGTAKEIRIICTSAGSLKAAELKEAQELRLKEAERKLEDCRAYLKFLLKKGKAGREQFRRKQMKESSISRPHFLGR